MGCATCGKSGVRSRSGMGARALVRNRMVSRRNVGVMVNKNPAVVNVPPTVQGEVIPANAMSENPASGVIPPQALNVQPIDLEVVGESETAAQEAKGE